MDRLHGLFFRFSRSFSVCTDYLSVFSEIFLSEHVQIVCPFLMQITMDKFKTLLLYKI